LKTAYHCVHCGRPVALEDTNVATDLALCRACGQTMLFSAISGRVEIENTDLSAPPRGVRVDRSLISGVEISYHRFSPASLLLVPFTAVWSGASLWTIYGRQIAAGKFDLAASLFGLPFLAGSVFLVCLTVLLVFGAWRLRLDRGVCEMFTGVGPLGRRLSIPLAAGTQVRLEPGAFRQNRVPQMDIVVTTGDRQVKFGATLPQEVRLYLAAVINKASRDA
jgi:DNA-directed RNA polymerase subunit RPC12/RpoP